ncbi:MAG: LysR family substrate-binding domain-containing protein [Rhodoglobus sp.]|uniref:LysR family substrate-binding domain-containing protein n=1 Tax=Salinibacterium sp. G-O1 TaxID=3046208 RepID=UPI0024B9741C|nr:LysR family substrate-binding domain-containing protein [Salinibacterium sp. G-O1]MDJ0335080.1 LysR family substrate-binding domain-containing protein [Salinibacterium sp. G-O1]
MVQPDNPAFGATLRVAFVVGVTPGKWSKVWAERLPRTYLELLPSTADAAVKAVEDGAADAALVRLPVAGEHLSSIPLYVELSVVVAPKDHAIEAVDSVSMADLAAETMLSNDVRGDDWAAVVDLVATGAGVAVMPQSVARALSRRDVVARPVTDGPETRIALAWLAANNNFLVEEFIGIVRGRTANSSRGAQPKAEKKPKVAKPRTPDRRPSRRR